MPYISFKWHRHVPEPSPARFPTLTGLNIYATIEWSLFKCLFLFTSPELTYIDFLSPSFCGSGNNFARSWSYDLQLESISLTA